MEDNLEINKSNRQVKLAECVLSKRDIKTIIKRYFETDNDKIVKSIDIDGGDYHVVYQPIYKINGEDIIYCTEEG